MRRLVCVSQQGREEEKKKGFNKCPLTREDELPSNYSVGGCRRSERVFKRRNSGQNGHICEETDSDKVAVFLISACGCRCMLLIMLIMPSHIH